MGPPKENGCPYSASESLGTARATHMPDSRTVKQQLAHYCLRQLLYHTPSSPLSGRFGSSLTTEELGDRFPFTDYAATYWLIHLGQCDPQDARSLPISGAPAAPRVMSSLSDLASALLMFLSRPGVASAWLEGFYTAVRPRSLLRDNHPQLHMLKEWLFDCSHGLLCHGGGSLPIQETALNTAHEFLESTRDITNTWRSRLRQEPSIV